MKRKERTGGFTLLELLVVIAIVAVLSTLLLAGFTRAKASAKAAACPEALSVTSSRIRCRNR